MNRQTDKQLSLGQNPPQAVSDPLTQTQCSPLGSDPLALTPSPPCDSDRLCLHTELREGGGGCVMLPPQPDITGSQLMSALRKNKSRGKS